MTSHMTTNMTDSGPAPVTINGVDHTLDTEARTSLLDFVRDVAGLTGTHAACEQGACGACNVLLDGEVVRSCLVLAAATAGHSVTTIEAVGTMAELHPVQQALLRHHGLQCGYCTPGVVMTALDLLSRVPPEGGLDEDRIREAFSGNLCRCTGYSGIVAAMRELAERQ